MRGEWKLSLVNGVTPSSDGLIRKCSVKYKKVDQDGKTAKHYTCVDRSVQRLVVLLPVEDI